MISIIYGKKGSGKTKQIIAAANLSLDTAKGDVVYITDTTEYTHEINVKIRYVACNEVEIGNEECFLSFIRGMISSNYDIEKFFVDGIARIIHLELSQMENLFKQLEKISNEFGCNFVFTISACLECMPEFLKKYIQ
ncbi:MAG: hypothetical protein RRZ69_03845 [Clostridia bacterium]